MMRMIPRLLFLLGVAGSLNTGCGSSSNSGDRDAHNIPSEREETLIVAHRGRSTFADPENVIESLESLSPWVDGVEIDVRISADDVPVLMHDRTVDRTTSGSGRIATFTIAELQALEAGVEASGGATVPTLESYLNAAEAFNFKAILLDMKTSDEHALRLVVEVLDRSALRNIAVLMVRSDEETAVVRQISSDIRLGRFGVEEENAESAIADLLEKQGELALTPPNDFDENVIVVEQAQAVGLKAGSSTNNDIASIQYALESGANLILTDISGKLGHLFND